MWNIKEEDLDEFRMTCNNRLSPEGAMVFFIGGIVYTQYLCFLFLWGLGVL